MKGLLFIGDPHVSSRRPGRRVDDYCTSVLEKLRVVGELAREHDFVPVILGDLFHIAGENDLSTLSRLTAVFKGYPAPPVVVGGNHDKKEKTLKDADALHLLAVSGTVEVVDGECREVHRYDFEGTNVALWVAPYGAKVPDKIESDADVVVLVTHADYAFVGAYPNAKPITEIKGCDFVVNGHMHKTAPSVRAGTTVWHNPGNIEPVSVDCIDHVPAVWSWEVGQPLDEIRPHVLPHVRDCFDLTGLMVPAATKADAVKAMIPQGASHFAELLSAKSKMEADKSDDNSSFIEELKAALKQLQAPKPVETLLLALEAGVPLDELGAEPSTETER